jgi:hypothetical protein
MRRLKILLILLYCTSTAIYSQSLEDRDKKIMADNRIKTKIQFDYSYDKGKVSSLGKKISISTYSQAGDILEEDMLDAKEQIIGWEKYQYNKSGNRILYERSSGTNTYKKESQYNTKNNVILETGFNGAENFKNTFSYGPTDKPLEIIYTINGVLDEKREYEYVGTTSIISIFKTGNVLASKVKLVYDERGNVIEETMFSMDNKELEKKTLSYDNDSHPIAEEKVRAGKFMYKLTNDYNEKGELLSVSEENTTDKKFIKKIYTFNLQDNLIEFKWRRTPTDEFNVKTYTYDSHGVCQTEHTFYPATKFELLTKYVYEMY